MAHACSVIAPCVLQGNKTLRSVDREAHLYYLPTTAILGDMKRERSASNVDDATEQAEPKKERKQRILFTDLPLEIRLHIYRCLLLVTPLHGSRLCPWNPVPCYRAYFLQVVKRNNGNARQRVLEPMWPGEGHGDEETERPRLLSPRRPVGFIPSAVLTACRQLYEEASLIPFHTNEFVFVSWFGSGLTAAKMFLHAMQPWQQDHMRYVRLEIRVKDIGLEERLREWERLCGLWSAGLAGLRLKVELEEQTLRAAGGQDLWSSPAMHSSGCEPTPATTAPLGWSAEPFRWVDRGLRKLHALRALEVELAGFPLSNTQKLAWVESVGRRVNGVRQPGEHARIICVQRTWDNTE